MHFEQIYLACLAHASYLIGDGGEAVVVDPRRDVDVYLERARELGLTIRHVVETHLHADFVSGHCELARRTGATIWVSHRANAEFEHEPIHEGDELRVGAVVLRFLETPGHTPESVTVLVYDTNVSSERPLEMLTGDTLFVGDVGRPDLAGARGYTAAEMAGTLYDSLHDKILAYPDEVRVWPAHGAGSACGKNISQERSSTLGEQRRTNHALRPMAREAFVALATDGLGVPPRYFGHDAEYNRRGAPALGELRAPAALEPLDVRERARAGALVLDVRTNVEYGAGHVSGAINLGLGGQLASWAGTLFGADTRFVLVAASDEQAAEARMRLARVGLERVEGVLAGGMGAWRAAGLPVAEIEQIDVDELRRRLAADGDLAVVDVRRPGEYEAGHVPGATSVPLDGLAERVARVDPTRPTAVICAGGYRSSAASGLLARAGHARLVNVLGGTAAWVAAGHPVEQPTASA